MSERRGAARVLAMPALLAAVTWAALFTALAVGGGWAVAAGLGLFVPLVVIALFLLRR